MAADVLAAVTSRLERDGRLASEGDVGALVERSPMASVRDARHTMLTGGRA